MTIYVQIRVQLVNYHLHVPTLQAHQYLCWRYICVHVDSFAVLTDAIINSRYIYMYVYIYIPGTLAGTLTCVCRLYNLVCTWAAKTSMYIVLLCPAHVHAYSHNLLLLCV